MGAVDDQRDQGRADDAPIVRTRQRPEVRVDANDLLLELREKLRRRIIGGKRLERLDDRLAGKIAVAVAAHAVGHRPNADLQLDEHAVLVMLADSADMADATHPECELIGHIDSPEEAGDRSAKAPVRKSEKRVGGGSPT